MRGVLRMSIICLAILIGGCVPSLYPLYNKSDLIQNPNLIGSWVNDDSSEKWEFSLAKDSISYELTYTESKKDDSKHFIAHMLQLDSITYLDTYPDEKIDNDFYQLHLVPAHLFGRIEIAGDTANLSLFDADWLRGMLSAHLINIAHEDVDNSLILTAQTADLQKMIIEHSSDPKAYSNFTVLHRE